MEQGCHTLRSISDRVYPSGIFSNENKNQNNTQITVLITVTAEVNDKSL